jgi:hypothetical protein
MRRDRVRNSSSIGLDVEPEEVETGGTDKEDGAVFTVAVVEVAFKLACLNISSKSIVFLLPLGLPLRLLE